MSDTESVSPTRNQRILLVAGSIVLSLLIAEVLARVILPSPAHIRVEMEARNNLAPADYQKVSEHPGQTSIYVHTPTGGRLRPNSHVTIERHRLSGKRVEIKTNSVGYRNAEVGAKKGRRILFLGDSITFADYLPEKETFVRQVEHKAREQGRDWETINAGVGAIGLENELAILMETGISLDPDDVVVCYYLNDFHESPGVRIQPLSWPAGISRLATHLWWTYRRTEIWAERQLRVSAGLADFKKQMDARRDSRSASQRRFDQKVVAAFADWGGAWSPHTWETIQAPLKKMERLSKQYGFQLHVIAFPVREQVELAELEALPQERMAAFSDRHHIPFLDLLPLLRQAHRSGTEIFLDHCHHTEDASGLIARAIFQFIDNPQ